MNMDRMVDDVRTMSSGAVGDTAPPTDQRMKRHYRTYVDQHGRRWGAVCENRTGSPCGPLEPQFSAPLRPLDKYITVSGHTNEITIRYSDILLDLDQRQAEWRETLVRLARREYGDQAHEAITNPPPVLLELVGPPPAPREPWEAAMQGNQWILGLTPLKPSWAEEFFPEAVEVEAHTLELSGKVYPDVEQETASTPADIERYRAAAADPAAIDPDTWDGDFPAWKGPQRGYQLSDGTFVNRTDANPNEKKHDLKLRSIHAELALRT